VAPDCTASQDVLLEADHPHPDGAVTATLAVPPAAGSGAGPDTA
jgi:hypothetical protein